MQRPLSPPVRRIVIGTHHLEYGFPSTHSANSMTMAIVVYYFVLQFRQLLHIQILSEIIHGSSLSVQLANSYMFEIILSLYVFSIVYGRLYLGMHTVLDCVTGMLIGALSAGISIFSDNLLLSYLNWEIMFGTYVTLIPVPLSLFAVGYLILALHPIPLQPCPCYEDVVCFIGAFVGVAMGNWRTNNFYYVDMHQLDSLWRWVTAGVSSAWQYRCRMMWTFGVVHRPAVRLCVSSAFAIVPLVLWKIVATPIIKASIPAMYHFFMHQDSPKQKSDVPQDPVVAATSAVPSGPELRQRPSAAPKPGSQIASSRLEDKMPSRTTELFCQGT